MSHDRLETLLRDRIGLAIESIGRAALELAVAARAKARGSRNSYEYAVLAATDPTEWDELLEQLVVPETWFFRGHATFELLREHVARLRQPRQSGAARPQLRILSLPCSTGEEPYSIVMTCLDQGWAPDQLLVDAVDLSRRALEAAASGEFGLRSFRETTPAALSAQTHYFQRENDVFRLSDQVRTIVRFRQGNAAGPLVFGEAAPYDIIFCRNLLIYLHEPARQRLCNHLHTLLRPGGLLFVGHAEPLWQLDSRFEIAPPVGAFAYSIRAAAEQISLGSSANSPLNSPYGSMFSGALGAPTSTIGVSSVSPSASGLASPSSATSAMSAMSANNFAPTPTTSTNMSLGASAAAKSESPAGEQNAAEDAALDQAEQLADQGDMESAERLCREYLAGHRPNARAWCLLGVVLQATGRTDEARPCFERAIYLEPDHLESLTHLMLAARVTGDFNAAENYLRRLERSDRRPTHSTTPPPTTSNAPRGTGVRR